MNFGPILESVAVSGVVVGVGAAAIYLRLRTTIQNARSETAAAARETAVRLEALGDELETWRQRLAETEQRYTPAPEGFNSPASMHLNRRGQVAQLYRRGETPRNIASALGLAQGEVKLIIKLYELNRSAACTNNPENLNLKSSKFLDNASGLKKGEA
jgi:hypothetical protein